jgi:hypothetical protein
MPQTFPEDIPKLDDPTARPDEPVSAGLDGTIGGIRTDPTIDILRGAYALHPTPQLRAAIQLAVQRTKGI